jgi:hypothetical protein
MEDLTDSSPYNINIVCLSVNKVARHTIGVWGMIKVTDIALKALSMVVFKHSLSGVM